MGAPDILPPFHTPLRLHITLWCPHHPVDSQFNKITLAALVKNELITPPSRLSSNCYIRLLPFTKSANFPNWWAWLSKDVVTSVNVKAKKKGGVENVTLHGSHAFKFVVPRAKNTMSVDNKSKLFNSYWFSILMLVFSFYSLIFSIILLYYFHCDLVWYLTIFTNLTECIAVNVYNSACLLQLSIVFNSCKS